MDFALLPPEINSARIYAGPGSAPMRAAATAWGNLAEDLYSMACFCRSAMSELTDSSWVGDAAAAATTAVGKYAAWLAASAATADLTAAKAQEATVAFETAFAMTVPPAAIAANRSLLQALVATNFLGQNGTAIATAEADYSEMWAQDVTAMYGYANASGAASTLAPFTPPNQETNATVLAQHAVAAARASGSTGATAAQTTLSTGPQLMTAVASALQSVNSPTQAAAPTSALSEITASLLSTSPLQYLTLLTPYTATISTARLGLAAASASKPDDPGGTTGDGPAAGRPATVVASDGPSGFLDAGAGSPPRAALGSAASIGGLTVPRGWTAAATTVRLSAASFPDPSAGGVPTLSGSGASDYFEQMAAASLATRMTNGTSPRNQTDGAAGISRPSVVPGVKVV